MRRNGLLAAALVVAFLVLAGLCACSFGAGSDVGAPETPAYYVFESVEQDGTVVTDPDMLILDGPGDIDNWYWLSVSLLDKRTGKLCTMGSIVNFTYDFKGGVITIHANATQGLDHGFNGAKFTVGDGTLTLKGGDVTVLRQVDEPPVATMG